MEAGMADPSHPRNPDAFFDHCDADKDGFLTFEEYLNGGHAFLNK